MYGFAQESILLTDSLNETEGILISRWLSSTWKFDDTEATDDTNDNVSDDKNTDEKENEKDTDNKNESDGDEKSDENQDEKKDRNEKCLESAGITEAEKNTIIIPYSNSVTDYKTIENEDYSLTYYVNDIARQNTQVLMEYGSQKELKNSYIYGNERIEKIEYGTSLSGCYSNIYDTSYTAGSVFAESDNGEIAAPLYNYYIYDGRGSVAQLINEQAELKASYTYDAYGNITYGSNVYESFYGYNAEETSAVTGLEYLRSRYYDTSVGRFNTPDTYLGDITNPQSLNRYAYAENNPVNYVDPSGHISLTIAGLIIATGGYLYKKYNNKKAQQNEKNRQQTIKDLHENSINLKNAAIALNSAQNKLNQSSGIDRLWNYVLLSKNINDSAKLLYETAELASKYHNLCQTGKKLNKKGKVANGVKTVGKGLVLIGLIPYVAEAALAEAGVSAVADTSMIGGISYRMGAEGITAFIGVSETAIGTSEILEGITGVDYIEEAFFRDNKEEYEGIKGDIDFATDIGLTYGAFGYAGNKINNSIEQPDEIAVKEYGEGGSGTGSIATPNSGQGFSPNGYNPQPGERTLNGYVKNNASPEVSLHTNSAGFNNNNGIVGGDFKRFGAESHGGVSPHVHQPQRNVAPNGNIYGTVGTKTANGGVTLPTEKDIKQLYEYFVNGKYH